MALFKLSASPAKPSYAGGFSVVMHLDGRPDPAPERTFQADNLGTVIERLESYIEDCEALGEPMAVCLQLKEGRAPNGFKAWKAANPFYRRVNV